ncbi:MULTISPECIES: hypothetical protein [Vibrio harveyi group]|uniref:hypothetical protein n=1 Tax=Vibrio harveyi group TaxID=717610 RepID=UPI000940FB03|nr:MULTISPECIES: hypothetical protein [Vibrio harveyi group]EGR3000165.1 hypothetical protein [Vibrio parahaemolyticus]EGR3219785.1 hypothetical protein [Vibrio parahaemolyticus]EJE4192358.1 hypothetical protein [Vibrio parahaemolyticus]OKQ14076.1 hypothetical protein H058_07320 [Vibrio antiquarius]TOL03097.1 hypothetical protein CGI09_15490 [Vibrio parahaemolyticus]
MKELLDKLSSYNLFNYLFPGIVYVAILEKVSSYSLIQKDIVIGVFLYYFIGLIISRIGSIIVEPILKKCHILNFADYGKYVTASKADPLIPILSEANNMYRTLCSMFFCLALTMLYEHVVPELSWLKTWWKEVLVFLILVLFVFSYKKQTDYITKRVNNHKDD